MSTDFLLFWDLYFKVIEEELPNEHILVISDDTLENIYQQLNTAHATFLTYPQLATIINNHIIMEKYDGAILTKSGAMFSKVEGLNVDKIPVIYHEKINMTELDGMLLNITQRTVLDLWLK